MGVAEAVRNPGAYAVERARMYRALLFDPGRFYDEFVGDRGLKAEALLVTLIGAVGSVGAMYAVYQIRGQFESSGLGSDIPRGVEFQLWGAGLEPLIGVFVLWALFTLALYVGSWLYSEEGALYTLFKNTAWALVPLVFANVILAIAFIYASRGAEVDTDLASAGGTTARRFAHVWEPIAQDTVIIGARAVGLLFAVWCGFIAAHGVADVRDIEPSQGYKVAGVAVALYVLWNGIQLIGAV